jgi:hypothetical protein
MQELAVDGNCQNLRLHCLYQQRQHPQWWTCNSHLWPQVGRQ